MEQKSYKSIEQYMLSCMDGSAHDQEHVYRVLYTALDIASNEREVDTDVLLAACLLHDIGRKEQFKNPALCHAQVGGEKAYAFLLQQNWNEVSAHHVKECIVTHRFRSDHPPQSLEAKILFDADKLDVTGAMGIARTLLYLGQKNEPLYTVKEHVVLDGKNDIHPSFFQEYHYKLKGVYGRFFTKRAAKLAQERERAAKDFYNSLFLEASASYRSGMKRLNSLLTDVTNHE